MSTFVARQSVELSTGNLTCNLASTTFGEMHYLTTSLGDRDDRFGNMYRTKVQVSSEGRRFRLLITASTETIALVQFIKYRSDRQCYLMTSYIHSEDRTTWSRGYWESRNSRMRGTKSSKGPFGGFKVFIRYMPGKSIKDLEDECFETNERKSLWEHMSICFDFPIVLIKKPSFPWKKARSRETVEHMDEAPPRRRPPSKNEHKPQVVKEEEDDDGSLLTGSMEMVISQLEKQIEMLIEDYEEERIKEMMLGY